MKQERSSNIQTNDLKWVVRLELNNEIVWDVQRFLCPPNLSP
jgi:hypothetical protein